MNEYLLAMYVTLSMQHRRTEGADPQRCTLNLNVSGIVDAAGDGELDHVLALLHDGRAVAGHVDSVSEVKATSYMCGAVE